MDCAIPGRSWLVANENFDYLPFRFAYCLLHVPSVPKDIFALPHQQEELRALTAPEVRAALADAGVSLTSFRDLGS